MSSVMIPVVVVGCSLVDCWRKGVFFVWVFSFMFLGVVSVAQTNFHFPCCD
jgi:hypothetical protein